MQLQISLTCRTVTSEDFSFPAANYIDCVPVHARERMNAIPRRQKIPRPIMAESETLLLISQTLPFISRDKTSTLIFRE